MGCWNETCFLTGLPVFSGEPVRMLFIAMDADGGWLPATLPIKGEYDDYGGLMNEKWNRAAVEMLHGAAFRVVHGDDKQPEPFDTSLLGTIDWGQALVELTNHAARDELEMLVPGRNPGTMEWRTATVLMAHEWAWNHFTDSIKAVQDDLFTSVTFRLGTTGPLRQMLREMSAADAIDAGSDEAKQVTDIAKVMRAMDDMRIGFHPTAGKGSQDEMSADWQLEFQKKRFVAAMSIPHRYAEQEPRDFTAAIAWERGRNGGIMVEKNNTGSEAVDMPEEYMPYDVWPMVLSAGLDNMLAAMAE